MKASMRVAGIALCLCAPVAMATDLTLTVTGPSTASQGETINIAISGLLSSDTDNEGLALFGTDMTVSGPVAVNLETAASISAGTGMSNFVSPDGLNNPTSCGGCFGFGGTASGDELLQIGGGQNTINNDSGNAPFPIGTVDTGIAHTTAVLATGTLTMPMTDGVYTISLANAFANVISQDETGPVFATEAVGNVTTNSLVVTVSAASPPNVTGVLSIADHGGTPLSLDVYSGIDVEPRNSGIVELEVSFDMAMDPLTTIAANVAVTGTNSGAYGGAIGASLGGGDQVLTITFTGALADADCHTIDLTGMTSAGGQAVANPTFVVRGVKGDVDRNGTTTTGDASIIKPHFNQSASTAGPEYDFNVDGTVTTSDFSQVKPLFNNSPGC